MTVPESSRCPFLPSDRWTGSATLHDRVVGEDRYVSLLSCKLDREIYNSFLWLRPIINRRRRTNLPRSTSRVHLWRRRGGRAAVRQLWAESLGPWHRESIIRHRRSKRHRRAIRVCRPAAMSRHNRLRRTATCHTPGLRWYFRCLGQLLRARFDGPPIASYAEEVFAWNGIQKRRLLRRLCVFFKLHCVSILCQWRS